MVDRVKTTVVGYYVTESYDLLPVFRVETRHVEGGVAKFTTLKHRKTNVINTRENNCNGGRSLVLQSEKKINIGKLVKKKTGEFYWVNRNAGNTADSR